MGDSRKQKQKAKNQEHEITTNGSNGESIEKSMRKRKHEEAPADTFDNGSNGVENSGSKKEKKKKKKEKEAREVEEVEQSTDKSDKKSRKDKKKKKNEDDGGSAAQQNGAAIEGQTEVIDSSDGVVVSGKNAKESKYNALKSFSEAALPENVLQCCKDFSKPSPIQSHAWPFLLDGRDFIGIAKTGSGKTLAFGIPAIMHVLGKRKGNPPARGRNPLCLVLSPTRELAQQIADVLCDAGKSCGVKSVCLFGGSSKGPQISELKSGVDIVIGTPGRLKDLIEMGVCRLKDVSFGVLDEADRMLDMGFEPDVRYILSQASSARQMVMFSATWPTAVHQLAQEFMDPNPIKVVVGSEDLAANHDVMQIVEVLDEQAKFRRLTALLDKYHASQKNRVLVFALYKKEAARVEDMLKERGWKAVAIHGDLHQNARTKALSLFKDGECPLLIATDVAARGLDIPDVEVVINYTFPLTTEDYVHRIGRTGRAGKKGIAHTFFTHHNKGLAGELVNVLREAGQVIPSDLMKFGTHVKKKESKLYGAHFREITADAPKATKITFDSDED